MERANLYYEVIRTKKGDLTFLHWLLSELRNKRNTALKTIIYCRNVKTVSSIYDFFHMSLGIDQFVDKDISLKKRLIAMYHRSTADVNKNFVLEEFKKIDSVIRVVVATSSFEMGLDFPDVSLVVNFSAPRSLESFAQQSGRGGRNISQAFSVVLWHGSSGKHGSTDAMKKYALSSNACRRERINDHFTIKLGQNDVSFNESSISPKGCRCCDVCGMTCDCGDCLIPPWKLSSSVENAEIEMEIDIDMVDMEFSDQKLGLLKCNLEEYREEVYAIESRSSNMSLSSWNILVDQIMLSCSYIFSIDDLLTETRIDDMILAEDLFALIEEIRSS